MNWRLGLDIGTNSLGWWAFHLESSGAGESQKWHPTKSIDGGVFIFSDGREPSKGGRVGDSLAVARRLVRGMRRSRDHGKNRIQCLVNELIDLGLLPSDAAERKKIFQTPKGVSDPFNPYRLRSEALERSLTPHELGRALMHLGIRRGYKSNRKEASDEDGGLLKERIEALKGKIGNLTLGQYLWDAVQTENKREADGEKRKGIRFRAEGDFYPDRALYGIEFEAIRAFQSAHHGLSEVDWDRLRDNYILFQWPLKPVERGRCEFFPKEQRHWKDTPIAHEFRIYQELNSLRWLDEKLVAHHLDQEQRDTILDLLIIRKSEVKFVAMRKLKRKDGTPLFSKYTRFNLENEKRKGLIPHKIAAAMRDDETLKGLWADCRENNDGKLDDIFGILHGAEDKEDIIFRLMTDFGLEKEAAERLESMKLVSGTSQVSRRFMDAIVPVLRDQGLVYSDAVAELTDDEGNALHHSLRDDGQRWDKLPYYGEVLSHSMLGADPSADTDQFPEKHFGKINNPTVHVALNCVRKVVNTLSDRFGQAPLQIHVELTRDLKLPRKRRDEINSDQAANQRENERVKQLCAEHGVVNPSARDIKKVKLWEELGKDQLARRCVFSGQTISAAQLFNGEVEIEHILPFSRTLDDSMANLTVAMRWANRLKGNRTPSEAFGDGFHAQDGMRWEKILQRAEVFRENKRRRFASEAMDRFEKDQDFLARQLTDTAYMARVSQRYLKSLKGVEYVLGNPGKLTAMVRGKWGLNGILSDDNKKTREDHRHHAVDAAVIALIDRSLLNAVSQLSRRGADDRLHILVPEMDKILEEAVRARIPQIITAFKPDHGLQGRMSNETAYGFVKQRDPDHKEHNLVTRKALPQLTPKECAAIRDPLIRKKLAQHLYEAKGAGLKHETALVEFSKETGIKRVRILIKNQTVQPVPSAPYKGYAPDSYVCCDIWKIPPKKKGGTSTWKGEFWAYAETVGGTPDKLVKKPHPAAKFAMRLFKDDMISFEEGGRTQVMRVAGFSTTNNRLDIRYHQMTNAKRNYVGINVLGGKGLKKLYVTPDGRILSAGRRDK